MSYDAEHETKHRYDYNKKTTNNQNHMSDQGKE